MKISQREARRLKKRVDELEATLRKQRFSYASEWPSSVVVARIIPSEVTMAAIKTARLLGHAVVAVPDGGDLAFFAARLAI